MIVLVFNVIIASVKIIYGYYANVLSISADGYDSGLDALANIIALVAIIFASKPENKKYPYGYAKIETFASLAIGFSLLFVSIEIISSAIDKFNGHSEPMVSTVSFIIMFAALLANYAISIYEKRKAKEYHSDVLMSDSQHTKSDVLVTGVVLIGLVFMKLGYSIVDPILSIIIAIAIIYTGLKIVHKELSVLLDKNQISAVDIINFLMRNDNIYNIHNVRTRGTSSKVYVDMHMVVDSGLTMKEAHDISELCEKAIKEKYPQVCEVLIHLESLEGMEDAVELE